MTSAPGRPASPALAFAVATAPLIGLALLQVTLPILAPVLMQHTGRPAADYGWVAGAVGLGSVILYVSNREITPTLGPVGALLLGGSVATLGAGLMLTGLWPLMLLGGLLVGFGYATTTPAGSQLLADHTPRARRGSLFSIRQAGVPLGGVIAGLSCAPIVAIHGWRTALAVMALIAGVLWLPLLLAPAVLNNSRPRPPFSLPALLVPANALAPIHAVRAIPGLGAMAIACIGFAAAQGAINAFSVTYYAVHLGLGLERAGQLFATQLAASVLGRILLGLVADIVGSPRPLLVMLAFLSGASAVLLAMMSAAWPTWLLFAASALVGFTVSTWNGLYLAEVALMVPSEQVSEATAGTTFFVFLTYMATPPAAGLIIQTWGFGAAFVTVALAAVAGGLVIASTRRKRSRV